MAIRITQAGVALTVGIIIVTALIVGGLFLVKNSGEQARREDAIKIAEQNLEEQSNDDVSLNDGEAENNSNESGTQGDDTANNEDTTETTNPSDSTDSSTSDQSSNQAANELPQTGPADSLVSVLTVAILTYSVFSYVASRQHLRS